MSKEPIHCCGNCALNKFEDIDGNSMCMPHYNEESGYVTCDMGKKCKEFISNEEARHHIAVLLQQKRWVRAVMNNCSTVKMPSVVDLYKAIGFAVNYFKTFYRI